MTRAPEDEKFFTALLAFMRQWSNAADMTTPERERILTVYRRLAEMPNAKAVYRYVYLMIRDDQRDILLYGEAPDQAFHGIYNRIIDWIINYQVPSATNGACQIERTRVSSDKRNL